LTRRKVVKSVERHIKSLLGKRFRDAVAEDKTKATIKTGKHGLARVTGGRGTSTRTVALLTTIVSVWLTLVMG
jgi:hypothetical protein